MLSRNNNDNDLPPWKRQPWWYGMATRDHVLLAFLTVCMIVTIFVFVIVVWGM